ncbi:hypothetical protein NPIL_523341, partial [Nephila pilipes]
MMEEKLLNHIIMRLSPQMNLPAYYPYLGILVVPLRNQMNHTVPPQNQMKIIALLHNQMKTIAFPLNQ